MGSLKNAVKQLKARHTPIGKAGYDNPRENIDPYIKTQAISTKELTAERNKFTKVGGIATKLINKTGAPTVKGQVVETSTTEFAFDTTGASALDPCGVVLDAGIADGEEAWIVVSGVADTLIDAGGCTAHDRMITSATAGSADVSNSPAVAVHFQEIGHAIETRVGAGLAKVILHFL